MKNLLNLSKKKSSIPIKKTGFFIFTLQLIIFPSFNILLAAEKPILSVVQSQENSRYWEGINKRLQSAGVDYCVIPLANVKTAADLGDRSLLFLPNIEILNPTQANALKEWQNQGGNLIATGPVATLSPPGVRQVVRNLLGGYWGFSLKDKQQIQTPKNPMRGWQNSSSLTGDVHGGVLVSNDADTQTIAKWNAQDRPPAVVSTDRATLLGWRWGTDIASSSELDSAWLKAAIARYSSSHNKKIAGGSTACTPAATTPEKLANNSLTPKPLTKPPVSDEAIDNLQQQVRWDVTATSQAPISPREAIALQQELENLIDRVESAHLAASANGGNANDSNTQKAEVNRNSTTNADRQQVISQARLVAKNIPQLVANKNYALARQQWLVTRNNLWKQFPIDRRLATAEIRAIWLDRGTIVRAGSEAQLAKIFDRLAQAGINTVFFETVNAGYTIYPSKVAPQQNPLIRGWNPLASAVKLAHERGMELHAWVWTFAAGNQRHNQILNLPLDYPGPVLAAHPDWANYDNQGRNIPLNQTKPFFDPANPELRQYLLKLYQEIVSEYQVDGLQLDYIRYPFQDPATGKTYGYGQAARSQFMQLTGVDPLTISPTQTQLWQQWTTFRTQQVDSFVNQVSQMLRQQRRNLILSVAVFPLPEYERIQKIQQNWEVWARKGDVDLIVPMTYAQDTVKFRTLAQPWIASTKLGSALLIPGIRLLSLPSLGALDQLQLVRDLPVSGYALFAAENLNPELQKLFANTQGNLPSPVSEPLPHRHPFKSALSRYIALRREWELVLYTEKQQTQSKYISEFQSQGEVLQNALTQLANSPSASKLLTARGNLTRLQALFTAAMLEQQMVHSYQAKTWENRLTIIDRLLHYGERHL